MMDYIGPLLLQVCLIALNAIFACAETAFLSNNSARIEKMVEEGDKNTKKKKYFQLFRQNTCTVHFFDILLQRQNGKTTFLDTKTSLERWQSGRLHRS